MTLKIELPPKTGAAFPVSRGDTIKVIDPLGGQVADMLAFNRHDIGEVLSNGRTIDYNSKIYFSTGDKLWSNRSQVMLEIAEDLVGRHDFLLTPCSAEMFKILYGHEHPHRGCFGNLAGALGVFGVAPDSLPTAFNVFMNVPVDGVTGELSVLPPLSVAGDYTIFEAHMDLIIGLTACSAPLSNGGSMKPIHVEISSRDFEMNSVVHFPPKF